MTVIINEAEIEYNAEPVKIKCTTCTTEGLTIELEQLGTVTLCADALNEFYNFVKMHMAKAEAARDAR